MLTRFRLLYAHRLCCAGITGVQFFKGSLRYRCALDGIEALAHDLRGEQRLLRARSTSLPGRQLKGGGDLGFALQGQAVYDTSIFCNSDPDICPTGSTCFLFDENPGSGTISFDSVPEAWLVLMQTLMLDGWSEPM